MHGESKGHSGLSPLPPPGIALCSRLGPQAFSNHRFRQQDCKVPLGKAEGMATRGHQDPSQPDAPAETAPLCLFNIFQRGDYCNENLKVFHGVGLLPSWRGGRRPSSVPSSSRDLGRVPALAVWACFLLVNGGAFSTVWVWEVEGGRWVHQERAQQCLCLPISTLQ